jgi:starch synthase (maltosyl-transferring)
MPADRSPIHDAVFDGKAPRAYALGAMRDHAARDTAAGTARGLGFDTLLGQFATAADPALAAWRDADLNAFARAAHDQGLLAWATISLDQIRSDHGLVAEAGPGVFGTPRPTAVAIVDPRLAVARATDTVRLRRPASAVLLRWWINALTRLHGLGFDCFALLDPGPAGLALVSDLTRAGFNVSAFHRAACGSPARGGNCFIDGGADAGSVHAALAFAAVHAEGWAVADGVAARGGETLQWINRLPRADGGHVVRAWTGAGAPLQIVSRATGQDGVVLVRNTQESAQAWPPRTVPAMPWQEFHAAPGYRLADGWLAPHETVLLHARALAPVCASADIDDRAAAAPQRRIVISGLSPSVDQGAFAVKAVVGDRMAVRADIFADGHEQLAAAVMVRAADAAAWDSYDMSPAANDVWQAEVRLERLGRHECRVEAWLDEWGGFIRDLRRKRDAGQDLDLEILEGCAMLAHTAETSAAGAALLAISLAAIRSAEPAQAVEMLLADELAATMRQYAERRFLARSHVQPVQVEREAARFSNWYELFPRSQTRHAARHGTFADVAARLPHIAAMGFDTLYFPPIHPIGARNRKGRNNALTATADDVGSPYAIGSAEGGHDSIHRQLGTLADFQALVAQAAGFGIEIALDFAIQCAPDHPWLAEHPGWFAWRPDGSIKYAENPPKKYQDIVNVDFYAAQAVPSLWHALRDVVLFWVAQGVTTFRVDNPHTKPLPFWQWMIGEVKARHPQAIFLSEAFTRPKPMYHLAKVGFSQSYTYFTWRNDKASLTAYLTELTQTDVRDYFRPHFFVNTPDINPVFLQNSGRAGFLIRAALAGTLSGLWGMYAGFELCEAAALPGREEYLDSEKYEVRPRPDRAPGDIVDEISQLNRLRRAEPALRTHLGLTFHNAFNDNVLYYSKRVAGDRDLLLIAVSLDPFAAQEADFEVPLWLFDLPDGGTVEVEDLLDGAKFHWTGKMQRLRLTPERPYAIWRIMALPGVSADV